MSPEDPGAWVVDAAAHSPCIDAGDPASRYASEPALNGGRINLGAYGGTPQASKLPLVAGRYIFYNNSVFDGNDPAAGPGDDAAIALNKEPLLPGQSAEPKNHTSFWRGINGIMIDINGVLPTTPPAGDFVIRVNDMNPDTWSPGPAPNVSVRTVDGLDRVTLIWNDGEIQNRWVEVTVKSDANGGSLGFADDDVFYFASSVGDCDGDGSVGDGDYDTLISQFGQRSEGEMLAADLDGDGRVGLSDFAIMRSRFGETVEAPTFPAAAPGPVISASPSPGNTESPLVTTLAYSAQSPASPKLNSLPSVTEKLTSPAVEQQPLTVKEQASASDNGRGEPLSKSVERDLYGALQSDAGSVGTSVQLDADDLLVDVLAEAVGSQLSAVI